MIDDDTASLLTTTSEFVTIGTLPSQQELLAPLRRSVCTPKRNYEVDAVTDEEIRPKEMRSPLLRIDFTKEQPNTRVEKGTTDSNENDILQDESEFQRPRTAKSRSETQETFSVSGQLVPSARSHISVDGGIKSFRAEYSPVQEWNRTRDGNASVLRAEVSRLEALNQAANKAITKAHHQIEEQESFGIKMQKQIKVLEAELVETKDRHDQLQGSFCNLQELLKEQQQSVISKQKQIDDLKHQLQIKDNELREREKEIERQDVRVQNSDAEITALKDACLTLQGNFKKDAERIEALATEEKKRTGTIDALRHSYIHPSTAVQITTHRNENRRLQEQIEAILNENKEIENKHRDVQSSRSTLQNTVDKLTSDNASLRTQNTQAIQRLRGSPQHRISSCRSVSHSSLEVEEMQEVAKRERSEISTRDCQYSDVVDFHSHNVNKAPHTSIDPAKGRSVTVETYKHHATQQSNPSPLHWDIQQPVLFQSSSHLMMNTPYATQHSFQDLQRLTQQLENRLLQLSVEWNRLQSEYAKMPSHSARTLAARQRKKEVENRMECISQDMSRIRFKLKGITGSLSGH